MSGSKTVTILMLYTTKDSNTTNSNVYKMIQHERFLGMAIVYWYFPKSSLS